jgi:hypothetical protein
MRLAAPSRRFPCSSGTFRAPRIGAKGSVRAMIVPPARVGRDASAPSESQLRGEKAKVSSRSRTLKRKSTVPPDFLVIRPVEGSGRGSEGHHRGASRV